MDDKSVFIHEKKILKNAKQNLKEKTYSQEEWSEHYTKLIKNYESLLKTSEKIFRISDIQGKTIKKREHEIKEANEARIKLVSEISHEIGSPMIAIQRFLKAMLEGMIRYDKESIEMTYQKVVVVNRLIEDLFELSKLEEAKTNFNYESININNFINSFKKYQLDCSNKKINFVIQPLDSKDSSIEGYIKIDLYRVHQVISNVINNALKYTVEGDSIRVHPSISTLKNQDFLKIEIVDTGTGIEPSLLPHLFNRFYKGRPPLDPKANSSGLGLAIAKEIILKHDGEIGVESTLGEGSTFYFTLPLFYKK